MAYKLIDQRKDIIAGQKSMALADSINRGQYPAMIRDMENEYSITLDTLNKQISADKAKALCAAILKDGEVLKPLTAQLMETLTKVGENVNAEVIRLFVDYRCSTGFTGQKYSVIAGTPENRKG